jgi:starch synthase (maltosyl-transferring)
MIAYAKASEDNENVIVVVVNLDNDQTHSGWMHLPLVDYGIDTDRPYMVHDLLSNDRYTWQGDTNYIELDPHAIPAHIFRVQRRMKREDDFDYYM